MGSRRRSAVDAFLILTDGELLAQCHVDDYRDRGPGGQKHNKSRSAIRLRHGPTRLIVTACERRSQHVNKSRAVHRLREAIALSVRSPTDLEHYEPSELLASCISRGGQLAVGSHNERYHPAVCEILDVISACEARVSDAAKRLGITTANLTKFVRKNRKLLERVNQMRATAGMRRLS